MGRESFSSREVARPSAVWRAFQDMALRASDSAGWTPARYRQEGVGFVLRRMTARHHREILFGDTLRGRTWISAVKKGIFFTRQVSLEDGGGPVAIARQEWVHIRRDMTIVPCGEALLNAFGIHGETLPVDLPSLNEEPFTPTAPHTMAFRCWHVWMDPLAHANHPLYVDFADEAIARMVAEVGGEPDQTVAEAEEIAFRSGISAPDEVVLSTVLHGQTEEGALIFRHRMERNGSLAATALLVRRMPEATRCAMVERFGGGRDMAPRGGER
ncbi:MAG: acyl-[acyl-carrier-protein] thioesterase [Myxococcales bacterium]|nr:acyl-[acyl-carrier-protein] thioesterase [Myxococcales bacterium]